MKRWPSQARVTFHSRGWMFFQFPIHYGLKTTLEKGPFAIFGIPLLLEQVDDNFSFKKKLQAKIPVWIRIPDLPPSLWTKSAIEKIASTVGDPMSVDERTIKKETLDGPRVQVMIDASIPARSNIELRTFSGDMFTQEIKFEFQPRFCSTYKVYGHYGRDCPGPETRGWQNQRPNHTVERRHPPRGTGPTNNGPVRHHSRPRTGGKDNEVPNQPHNKEKEGQGAKPLELRWKETGGTITYPAHIKTLHNKNGDVVHSSRSGETAIPTSPNRFSPLAGEGGGDNGNEDVPPTKENDAQPGPPLKDQRDKTMQEKCDAAESSMTADSKSTEWVLASEVQLNKNWEHEVTGPAADKAEEAEWESHEIATIPPDGNFMGNPNLASSSFPANGSVFVSDRNKATDQHPGIGDTDQTQEVLPEGNDKGKGKAQDKVEVIAERALQKINTAKGKGQQNGKKKPPSHNTPSKKKKGHSATKRGLR